MEPIEMGTSLDMWTTILGTLLSASTVTALAWDWVRNPRI